MHNWLCCKVPHIINNIRDFIKTVRNADLTIFAYFYII